MQAVNYTTLRDNMKTYFDKIADDKEPLIVTRKEENMIIMSQSLYDNIMETLHQCMNFHVPHQKRLKKHGDR